jgi:hypothetical protein
MGFLTKEQIQAIKDLPIITVDIPQWGGKINIKSPSCYDRDRMAVEFKDDDNEYIRAKLAVRYIVDEKGERMFTDGDIKMLAGKSPHALDIIFKEIQKLMGFNKEEVEEVVKN